MKGIRSKILRTQPSTNNEEDYYFALFVPSPIQAVFQKNYALIVKNGLTLSVLLVAVQFMFA